MKLMSRRHYLRGAIALGAAAQLAGCKEIIDVLGQACPEDPADQGGIDWVPDVMFPVAAGFEDVDVAQGAPGPARIWHPTFEVFTEGGPPTPRRILKHCLARWPVVPFLDGMPPRTFLTTTATGPPSQPSWRAVATWWSHLCTITPSPRTPPACPSWRVSSIGCARYGSTPAGPTSASTLWGIVGHSYGALLGARVATARSDISACAFLSGPWGELNDRNTLLRGLARPTFYMFATDELFEDVNDQGLWDSFEYPKYSAEFEGSHFDYIPQPPRLQQAGRTLRAHQDSRGRPG